MKRSIFFLGAALVPVALGAQERGMLMESGAWQAPNPTTALRALMEQTPGSTAAAERQGHHAAVAVLRQTFEQRSAAELHAFADDLLRLMREGAWWQQTDARMALLAAAGEHGTGIPYAGAVDAFVQLYESFTDRASEGAKAALGAVFDAGGVEQVREVFEASEPPPACVLTQRKRPLLDPEGNVRRDANGDVVYEPPPANRCPNPPSTWCNAGFLLLHGDEAGPLRGAPDQDLYRRLCEWGVTISA